MTVWHYVLGYEEDGESLAFKQPIRESIIIDLRAVVNPHDDDPDLLDVYQLNATQITRIEAMIGEQISTAGRSFFLQAFSAPINPSC